MCIDISPNDAACPFFDTPRGGGNKRGSRGPPPPILRPQVISPLPQSIKKGHAASLEHILRYKCARSGVNWTSSLAGKASQRFGTRSCFTSFASPLRFFVDPDEFKLAKEVHYPSIYYFPMHRGHFPSNPDVIP